MERAKQEMSEAGLLPEEWGGETPMVPVSVCLFTLELKQLLWSCPEPGQ